MNNNKPNLKSNEQGLVSIIVTMIFLIVLSLMVLGFAQIARREQRASLDRQLSSQAFYAAESGINLAKNAINSPGNIYSYNAAPPMSKKVCDPDSALTQSEYELDGGNTKTTCILIDQTPEQLDWTSINPTKTKVVPIKAFNKAGSSINFNTIKIGWQNEGSEGTEFFSGSNFPIFSKWNDPVEKIAAPVLRVELIPVPEAPEVIKRDNLISNTFTAFLRPTSDSSASNNVNFSDASGSTNRGALIPVYCTNTPTEGKKCQITISGLTSHEYYLRMRTEYRNASVNLTGEHVESGTNVPTKIGGAQAVIDATGKASYVLKRIQVKMPYKVSTYDYPEGVIESGDAVCKRLKVLPDPNSLSDCTGSTEVPNIIGTPSGGEEVEDGKGNALVSSCGQTVCTSSTGSKPDYRWKFTLYNISGNPNDIVRGCKWEYGDGVTYTGVPTRSADACLDGQWITHTYKTFSTNPLDVSNCRIYKAKLTVSFKNGYKDAYYPLNMYVPGGTAGKAACNGHYKNYTP